MRIVHRLLQRGTGNNRELSEKFAALAPLAAPSHNIQAADDKKEQPGLQPSRADPMADPLMRLNRATVRKRRCDVSDSGHDALERSQQSAPLARARHESMPGPLARISARSCSHSRLVLHTRVPRTSEPVSTKRLQIILSCASVDCSAASGFRVL